MLLWRSGSGTYIRSSGFRFFDACGHKGKKVEKLPNICDVNKNYIMHLHGLLGWALESSSPLLDETARSCSYKHYKSFNDSPTSLLLMPPRDATGRECVQTNACSPLIDGLGAQRDKVQLQCRFFPLESSGFRQSRHIIFHARIS